MHPKGLFWGPLLSLICVSDMSQAVKFGPFLYVDNTCLVCQSEDIDKIENQLNEDKSKKY